MNKPIGTMTRDELIEALVSLEALVDHLSDAHTDSVHEAEIKRKLIHQKLESMGETVRRVIA